MDTQTGRETNNWNVLLLQLTVADLTLTTMGNVLEHFSMGEPVWSKFPLLQAIKKNVEAEPKINEWIKSRPQTPF